MIISELSALIAGLSFGFTTGIAISIFVSWKDTKRLDKLDELNCELVMFGSKLPRYNKPPIRERLDELTADYVRELDYEQKTKGMGQD